MHAAKSSKPNKVFFFFFLSFFHLPKIFNKILFVLCAVMQNTYHRTHKRFVTMVKKKEKRMKYMYNIHRYKTKITYNKKKELKKKIKNKVKYNDEQHTVKIRRIF